MQAAGFCDRIQTLSCMRKQDATMDTLLSLIMPSRFRYLHTIHDKATDEMVGYTLLGIGSAVATACCIVVWSNTTNPGGTLRVEQVKSQCGELLVEHFEIFARFRVCLQLVLWLVCCVALPLSCDCRGRDTGAPR